MKHKEESRWLLEILILIAVFKNVLASTRGALGAYCRESVEGCVCEFEMVTVGVPLLAK